jgi:orotidine-5'-phosphate decarboxylase
MIDRPIILALDTREVSVAKEWILATRDSIDVYKVGLEFFLRHGRSGLEELRAVSEFELFLDLKLHDIPNTVAAAVTSVADLKPKFLTVHAGGGSAMVKAAVVSAPEISITGVTVLTSLNESELKEIGYAKDPLSTAADLALLAVGAGAASIVSSPFEVSKIREVVGPKPTLITPGVRPAGSAKGDQQRVMTPVEAIAAGADYLVIGRPITGEWEKSGTAMSVAAAQILSDIQSSLH